MRSGHGLGFRGSVRFKNAPPHYFSDLVHAVRKKDHHYSVCGYIIAPQDDRRMSGNGNMEMVTCLWCWTTRDPFP